MWPGITEKRSIVPKHWRIEIRTQNTFKSKSAENHEVVKKKSMRIINNHTDAF